jgi:hypothetical protein
MHTTAKPSRTKSPKRAARRPRVRKAAPKKPGARAVQTPEDLALREKIGKTLDVAAFMAYHKKNADTSRRYWETKE